MKKHKRKTILATLLFASGCLLASSVLADKPDWAGGGKPDKQGKGQDEAGHGKHDKNDKSGHGGGGDIAPRGYFTNDQRSAVRGYYGEQFKGGHCPPGLAKKNNGCLPPGLAKKWAVGRPLGDLTYYSVPAEVQVRLGYPPAGYKYVRVAADILLIAVGTNMVVDAIEDLGGLY